MIDKKSVLAIVPARGGSKGIPLKNLRTVGGQSLIARVGAVVGHIAYIDRAVVSTDHDGIAAAAEEAGLGAPFRRPKDLSGDRIGDLQVLTHGLMEMERLDRRQYDVVVMLQPTSPLRTPVEVNETIRRLIADNLDSAWTVSPTDSKHHPAKQLTVQDGRLGYYEEGGAAIIARQQLSPLYHRNGVAYAMTRECLLEKESIMGERTGAVICDGNHISIDTEQDIELVEYYLKRSVDHNPD